MDETRKQYKGAMIPDRELTPTEARNAWLMLSLMVYAKTLQAVSSNAKLPDSEAAAKDSRDWITSLVAHGLEFYGDGRSMEAETLALCNEIGLVIEQHDMSKLAQA